MMVDHREIHIEEIGDRTYSELFKYFKYLDGFIDYINGKPYLVYVRVILRRINNGR